MATRVFELEELATQIATSLLAISLGSTVALGLTCRALEVPARKMLRATRGSFKDPIMHVLTTDASGFKLTHRSSSFLLVSYLLSSSSTGHSSTVLHRLAPAIGRRAVAPGLNASVSSLITKNSTGVAATAYCAGIELAQTIYRFEARERDLGRDFTGLWFLFHPRLLRPYKFTCKS